MATLISGWRRGGVIAIVAAGVLVAGVPAHAAHRARVSRDVTDAVAAGSATVDVIVHGSRAGIDAIASRYNLVVRRYLHGSAVLRVNAGQLDALQRDDAVDHVSGDAAVHAADVTTETIGADQLWSGPGRLAPLTGKGVSVAVIDSGMDVTHNALKGRVLVSVDFTGGNGADQYGHGTHVASIIAGQGGRSADTRDFRGVAPGAYLVNLRVLGADGSGRASDLIDAIDWAIDHRVQYRIGVINLSLGAPVTQSHADDPLCEAVERAVRAGIVVVASAGNFGKLADGRLVAGGIVSPGNSPYALTVGAVDTQGTPRRSDDAVASYSSRGPTQFDQVLKPDVVAPGSHVVGAEVAGSYFATNFPQRHVAGSGPNAFIELSGTSMAAAVVSGAAALLVSERPALKPTLVRTALQATSTFLPAAGLVGGGAGSVDVLAAAELVGTGRTSQYLIGGEPVIRSLIAFASPSMLSDTQLGAKRDKTIRGDAATVIWGNAATVIWGNTATVIWGNADTVIWGNADTVIWGNADTVIWGNADTVIWGNADTVIWGNADTVIWGNADTVIWGNAL